MISAVRDIARDPGDEDLADAEVKHQLDRHARIDAGQYRGEGLLLLDGLLLEDLDILGEVRRPTRDEAGIAIGQLLERLVRRERGLRPRADRKPDPAGRQGERACRGAAHGPANEMPPRQVRIEACAPAETPAIAEVAPF
jgi:hypothetical protein